MTAFRGDAFRFAGPALLALAAVAITGDFAGRPSAASEIRRDESVVVFPTAARLDPSGARWRVPLHAWIFEREDDSILRALLVWRLADWLELPSGSEANAQFQQRARDFLVENQDGKVVALELGGQHDVRLPESGSNGHSEAEVSLPSSDLPRGGGSPWLRTAIVRDSGGGLDIAGGVQLVAPKGISVISDIDDTIKISHVTDKRQLLEHTFLRPFEAVPGMARAYGRWERTGAVFHYVSSSPWQLYPALADFMARSEFPRGSFHLRDFRVKDESLFNLLKSSAETKPPLIDGLLEAYPGRRFVLVGDSGEVDPEIYGETARTHPGQVHHIYIRLVTYEDRDSPRMQDAFDGLPDELWTLFREATELPVSLR